MKSFFKYLSVFLLGVVLSLGLAFMLALKRINVTNADTVIENLQQSIKKLKQKGDGNTSEISMDVTSNQLIRKTRKELRQEKREQRKCERQKQKT